MKSIVVGAGKFGFEVSKRLAYEGHDVAVIDRSADALREVDENLDVLTVEGNGANLAVLEAASVKSADLFVAVTNIDEVNMVSCVIAKQLGVKTTIARIRNSDYHGLKDWPLSNKQLGIDLVIQPEDAVAREIAKLVRRSAATAVQYFADGKAQMVGFLVQDGAPIANKTVQEVDLTASTVGAILRGDSVLVPKGDTRILAGDEVFVIGKAGGPSEVGWLAGKSDEAARNIVIVGGGRIGLALARLLERHRKRFSSVRLIERDRDTCVELAQELRHTLVIHGDGSQMQLLGEERINDVDVFISVTGSEQTNLVAGFMAKHLGARRAIALLNRQDFVSIATAMNIDATVTPRIVVSGTILSLLRRGQLESIALVREGNLEVMEMSVPPRSLACTRPLSTLGLPSGIVVGAVIREDKVLVPRGDTRLRPADHIVLFATPAMTATIDRYFRPE